MDAVDTAIDHYYRREWAKVSEVMPPAIASTQDPKRAMLGSIILAVAEYWQSNVQRAGELIAEAIEKATEWPMVLARAHWERARMYRDPAGVDRAIELWHGQLDADPEAALFTAWARGYVAAMRDEIEPAANLYLLAAATLSNEPFEHDPKLCGFYSDLTEFHDRRGDADAALAARIKAVEVARAFAGPGAQFTLNMAYAISTTNRDASIACIDGCIAAATDGVELARLWYARAVLATDPAEGLRQKETALRERERAVGILGHDLIAMRDEIKDGWIALGRANDAEAFVRRCRDAAGPETWVHRNLTHQISNLLRNADRRDEYLDLWRAFVAAREAVCAHGSDEHVEALEIAAEKIAWYEPENFEMAERAVAARATTRGLNALAKSYRKADRRDEARAAWRRAGDRWILDLRAGLREHEPAIGDWANDYDPYDGAEQARRAAAIYDEMFARALVVVGVDEPAIAQLAIDRATLLSTHLGERAGEAGTELERLKILLERVEGPTGKTLNNVLFQLAGHHDRHSSRDVAILWLRELISIRSANGVIDAMHDRDRLAQWLEGRGDSDEALAIRERLADEWPTSARPYMVLNELQEIARMYRVRGDLAKATETCARFADNEQHANNAYAHGSALDAWWELANAKCEVGDLEGARAAIDALVELWKVPEMVAFVDNKRRDAFANDSPIALHLYARIGERVFADAAASRALATSVAPELTSESAMVLADALSGAGDPRGELIVLGIEIAASPDDGALTDRLAGLLSDNRARWVGPLAEDAIAWSFGYWKTITLGDTPRVLYDDLSTVFEHPSAQYLDTVVLENVPADLDDKIVAAADHFSRIAHVKFAGLSDDEERLAKLHAAIPKLEV